LRLTLQYMTTNKKKFRLVHDDKVLIITGPWELELRIDFDDVDQVTVEEEAEKLVALLNENWH
jgi:hypothetical protein